MGCGCKKKKNVQTAEEPSNISLSNVMINETTQQNPTVQLTEEQQNQVNQILDKLGEMSSN
jgi:hypothetical protein